MLVKRPKTLMLHETCMLHECRKRLQHSFNMHVALRMLLSVRCMQHACYIRTFSHRGGKCQFLILLFKLLTQLPFVSSPLCSLSQSSLYSLSTISSFSSDQFFFCPPKIKTLHSVSPMAHIFAFCFSDIFFQ